MRDATIRLVSVSAVFFVIMAIWRGDIMSAAFSTAIFAMVYAAILAAKVIFRSDKE